MYESTLLIKMAMNLCLWKITVNGNNYKIHILSKQYDSNNESDFIYLSLMNLVYSVIFSATKKYLVIWYQFTNFI